MARQQHAARQSKAHPTRLQRLGGQNTTVRLPSCPTSSSVATGDLSEYDAILWIDADAWLQQDSTVETFFRAIGEKPDHLAITPAMDAAYFPVFEMSPQFVETHIGQVFDAFYPEEAMAARCRPLLTCGAFAMHRASPLWDSWAKEVERLYGKSWDVAPHVFHVADQTALNHLAYQTGLVAPLDARHSFIACLGRPQRNAEGRVVTDRIDPREIGIVQLAGLADQTVLQWYLRDGLFFDCGRYLTGEDLEALRSLERS